ncbi:hypothetical protein ElyMa_005479500 [Elysia marginata]|uniref:Uncharacterized protein n=1 Tax=Elysia marginata TaxID=1093978 RepID=A0AAV4EQA3_9GAST|nr:hypothetical protein ElyMa_005479500 [Elysia marginata]
MAGNEQELHFVGENRTECSCTRNRYAQMKMNITHQDESNRQPKIRAIMESSDPKDKRYKTTNNVVETHRRGFEKKGNFLEGNFRKIP